MANQPTAGIHAAWTLYRQCAATARFHKARLELLTKVSVWLAVVGAVIGSIAEALAWPPGGMPGKIMGALGALAVALAGAAATQAVGDNREKTWVKCRGAGEGLKSAAFLYSAGVAPYNGPDRSDVLTDRVDAALKEVAGIELRTATAGNLPTAVTVDAYITQRVDDQITWYNNTAAKLQKKADFWRAFSGVAAAVSAAMGAVSVVYSLSPWIALLATITTSVMAYVKNQRYSNTVGLYQATAMRLQLLKDRWLDSGKSDSDKPERDSFIQHCEQTMSVENGAWSSQWLQPPLPPAEKSVVAQ